MSKQKKLKSRTKAFSVAVYSLMRLEVFLREKIDEAYNRTFPETAEDPPVKGDPQEPGNFEFNLSSAQKWVEQDFQLQVTSSLPQNEQGEIIWELAEPMMGRELGPVIFAAIAWLGLDPDSAKHAAWRITYAWHGLDPDAVGQKIGPEHFLKTNHD